jgi:hypothetical protein
VVGEPLPTNNPRPEEEVAPAATSSKLLQRGAKGKSGKMKRGNKSGPVDKMVLDMLEKTLKVTEGNLAKHRETQGTNQEYKRKEEAFVYRIAELSRSIQAAKPPETEQTPKLSTRGYSPGENRWSKVYDQVAFEKLMKEYNLARDYPLAKRSQQQKFLIKRIGVELEEETNSRHLGNQRKSVYNASDDEEVERQQMEEFPIGKNRERKKRSQRLTRRRRTRAGDQPNPVHHLV